MDDHRFARLATEHQVAAQVGQLDVSRREAAVVVEARLSHRDDTRVRSQFFDSLPVGQRRGSCSVGVNSGSRVDVSHRGELNSLNGRLGIPTGDEDALEACQPRRR
jgi:hypothetical protein